MLGNTIRLKHVDIQTVIDLAKQMSEQDIHDFLETHGDLEYYQYSLHQGTQRRGQAFFNALDTEWRDLIAATSVDPFNKLSEWSVFVAIAWLTAQEIANES